MPRKSDKLADWLVTSTHAVSVTTTSKTTIEILRWSGDWPVRFYHVMLCWHGICCCRVSVCPSHAGILYFTKMAKRMIMQIMPYYSLGTLVFWWQKSWRNSVGVTANGGTKQVHTSHTVRLLDFVVSPITPIIMFINFAVSAITSIPQLLVPLPPLSSTPNLIKSCNSNQPC